MPQAASPPSRSPWRHRALWMTIPVLIGAGGFALAGLSGRPATTAVAPPSTVTTVAAARRDMPRWIAGVGTVTPLNEVMVKARVDGQLDRIAFQEGQMVNAGDLLAEIDPRPYQAALVQAEAAAKRDEAQRRNAELDLSRYQKLSTLQVVPRQQLDSQKAQAESLLATVAADRGAADAARLNVAFTRITAPMAGRVGQRLMDQGAQVHAADTTGIVTVTQIEPITVVFPVSQDLLADVVAAERLRPVHVEATARDGSAVLGRGTLTFVDSQVAASTGQVLLKAQFENHDHALWPGAFVAARLLLDTQAQVITVPSQAVQRDQAGDFVYVVDASHVARQRRITTGLDAEGYTVITRGVAEGERVIVEGQGDIQPGVRVVEASRAQPGASA
ncbi:efflux RND transporter periplasmic adaptor subunit [Luteibacter aegosomatissinici]|uniref:efflux RND transporter periplasmic adaptor subunit n=1 Tax=Luteibacter aegosomatissinici TaxID=2911539 RepID=UPI001FFA3B12|nr:efflux RND transporter periplasmic adaptor subunit [Luteibacter aegosomatissinici]UPG96295.1 efflux RND transporter periplasmic adaptor subunit [Luteibacter aegosomatissinici]